MAIAAIGTACAVAAQDRPLQTADAEIVAPGDVRLEGGFDFLHGQTFPLSGLKGDLTNAGVINVRIGVARIVEIQVQGIAQQFLSISSQGPPAIPLTLTGTSSTHDVGDFSLWTKIRLMGQEGRRPSLGFRFGYEIPNSNQARGIGTNTTNIFADFIAERKFGKLKAFGNAGLEILQSPNALFSQNDELHYGAALSYEATSRVHLVAEVNGRYSSRKITTALLGTESHGQGRFGVQIEAGGFTWDVAGIAGVNKADARGGFTFGVSKDLHLFGGKKNP
ncbi:MAG TPA: hypothetical protein VFO34_08325 [Candidatus Acidoferrales bacterium]|nr:hypothetical protein [Candidatus Acidoferrales bacterium]